MGRGVLRFNHHIRLASILVACTTTGCIALNSPIVTQVAAPTVAAPAPTLSVTIARASAQAASATTLPITFDITFNKAVTGFTDADITFNGGTSDITYNLTGSGTTYQLQVTAVAHNRRVVPTIVASAAVTDDGLTNTSAVTAATPQVVSYIPLNFKDVQVSYSGYFTCGLTGDGVIYCWGRNNYGQLGSGVSFITEQPAPVAIDTSGIAGEKTFAQLSVGGFHVCAITTQGVAYCWGRDNNYQLGNGAVITADQTTPSPVDTSTITGEKTFTQISAAGLTTCGITGDGVAYCWGRGTNGELGNGSTAANIESPTAVLTGTITGEKTFVQIAVGSTHSCGITSESVAYCWGTDTSLQLGNGATVGIQTSPSAVDMTNVTGEQTFKKIYTMGFHTCGLTGDGVAYCWGSGWGGSLGNAGTADQNRPVAVDTTNITGEKAFKQISMGNVNTCGITTEGVPYCWGVDTNGKLGNGAVVTADQTRPYAVDLSTITGSTVFSQISTGVYHSCGVIAGGSTYCWGHSQYGQLGDGSAHGNVVTSPSLVTTTGLTSDIAFTQVTSGNSHSCGVTATGLAYCWGDDTSGQLGNGATFTTTQGSPSLVDTSTITGSKVFVQLSAALAHTCGVLVDGAVYCWGSDVGGLLGNGATAGTQSSPSAVDRTGVTGNASFIQVSAGIEHTCGITSSGKAYCWGDDSFGQLGNGATAGTQTSPSVVDTTTVAGKKSFLQISVGLQRTCAVMTDGAPYCWGSDSNGALGNGATAGTQTSPSAVDTSTVTGKKAFVQISAGGATGGGAYVCGLTSELLAYCWGTDTSGLLGNGGGITGDQVSPSPVDVTAITGNKSFQKITAGSTHACAVTADGNVYCWGSDSTGQIGNGAALTSNQDSPVAVDTTGFSDEKGMINVSAGYNHACSLTPKGTAYCWGLDTNGVLGNGDALTAEQSSPSQVDPWMFY